MCCRQKVHAGWTLAREKGQTMSLSESGFQWAAAPQERGIFTGFNFGPASTKRKFSWTTEDNQNGMITDNECPAKRICSETLLQAPGPIFTQPPAQPMQHVVPSQLSPISQPPMPHRMDTPSVSDRLNAVQDVNNCLKTVHEPSNPISRASLHPESDMVMDLCDETYSSPQHDEDLDSACNSMDSDCVPDPQQYKTDSLNKNTSTTPSDIGNIVYCSTPCKGGERSPSSNMVRCFCRPLDAFLNVGPYVSDYY